MSPAVNIRPATVADGQALLQSWYSEECRAVLGHLVEKLGGGDVRS